MTKNDFCCEEMSQHLSRGELHFHYRDDVRAYLIDYLEEAGGGAQLINYCPWCGSKLPKALFFEKADAIKNDTGLEITCFNESLIPSEFESDEWWKKRGL